MSSEPRRRDEARMSRTARIGRGRLRPAAGPPEAETHLIPGILGIA